MRVRTFLAVVFVSALVAAQSAPQRDARWGHRKRHVRQQ